MATSETLSLLPITLISSLVLASVYIFGYRLQAKSHHRLWVSIAGGVSVSTIFVDLLPEISESQARFSSEPNRFAALFPEQAVYLAAMLGFVLFYGLEYMVASAEKEEIGVFSWVRLVAFAGYSGLIAYLLVRGEWRSISSLLLYSLAMAFHLLLVDHSLAREDSALYKRRGKWVLALAVLAGWLVGVSTQIPEQWLARITGFICGGVIMNTLVVELPEGRGGRFWPFVLAALVYSLVLILILG